MMMDIQAFFHAVLVQDAQALRAFFHEDAWVNWPCTNEHFTLEEYIRANCEYPGDWDGELERATVSGTEIIMACRVYPRDRSASFHAVSFLQIRDGRIASMTEYWADDGPAPAWRQEMRIGRPLNEVAE